MLFLPRYTQHELVRSKTGLLSRIYGKSEHQTFGVPLAELKNIGETLGLEVELHTDFSPNDEKIKSILAKYLSGGESFIIANYLRSAVGQRGGGHFAILGAFDESSDSALIMDPLPEPWVWVRVENIVSAMATRDGDQARGFLRIKIGPT